MLRKIRSFVLAGIIGLSFVAPIAAPGLVGVASAATNNISSGLCDGSNIAADTQGNSCTSTTPNGSIQKIAKNVVNIFSIIVGVIAVIMIVYGGFKYITSGGDSGNVSAAKNTLIYAIVGLIVVALAQLIVNVVLTTSSNITT